MTVQEAKQQIDDAERKINIAFVKMKDEAATMTDNVEDKVSSNVATKTCIPLIICVIGIVCCTLGSWGWGLFFIVVGGIATYCTYSTLSSDEYEVSRLQKDTKDQLNNIKDI